MVLTYILFIVGFLLLIKGADLLVEGASSIAKNYRIPDMVVGLTIVSLGTSMPELLVNVISSLKGSAGLAMGNVLGSNIANVLLILGVTAVVHPLPLKRSTIFSEIPFAIIASLLIGFLSNTALGFEKPVLKVSRWDGGILLLYFLLFMGYIISVAKEDRSLEMDMEGGSFKVMKMGRSSLYIGLGILGLFLGGKWVVDGAMLIATSFGLSEGFIGLTVVAVGTSLPELVTSVMAAWKKNVDIAVGNVIGSNIFNILWILGISSMIRPLPFNTISNTDIGVMVLSNTLLLILMPIGKKRTVGRLAGILFVLIYIAYIVFLVKRG